MRTPTLKHVVSHYTQSVTTTNGEDTITRSLVQTFPAFMQQAPDKVVEQYKQNGRRCTCVCYLADTSACSKINEETDTIAFQSKTYRILNKQDFAFLGRVYRLDLEEEIA